jgi:hypothetical protein
MNEKYQTKKITDRSWCVLIVEEYMIYHIFENREIFSYSNQVMEIKQKKKKEEEG